MRAPKRPIRFLLLAFLIFGIATPGIADHTRQWKQSTYDEFLKGTAKGVAVRSDGHLELAPKFTLVADADASYLWSLRTDPSGALYASGGSPAKVFRFDTTDKAKTVFQSTELLAQCIAFESKGSLYVGTSPDGKVYEVTANGEKSVFFDPKTKYIWDLAFGSDGTLYVATGDQGQSMRFRPTVKVSSITPATKPTLKSSRLTPRVTCSPAPNRMAVSCVRLRRKRRHKTKLQTRAPRKAPLSTKPQGNAKSLRWLWLLTVTSTSRPSVRKPKPERSVNPLLCPFPRALQLSPIPVRKPAPPQLPSSPFRKPFLAVSTALPPMAYQKSFGPLATMWCTL